MGILAIMDVGMSNTPMLPRYVPTCPLLSSAPRGADRSSTSVQQSGCSFTRSVSPLSDKSQVIDTDELSSD